VRQAAAIAVAGVGVGGLSFVTHGEVRFPVAALYQDYLTARTAYWADKPDPYHVELMDVLPGGLFVQRITTGTASLSPGTGPYPSGGYRHPDGWDRYRW
jgi:hypothetical protein